MKGCWGRTYIPAERRLETHHQSSLGKTDEALKQKVDKCLPDVLSHHVFRHFCSAQGNEYICGCAPLSPAPVLPSNIKDCSKQL